MAPSKHVHSAVLCCCCCCALHHCYCWTLGLDVGLFGWGLGCPPPGAWTSQFMFTLFSLCCAIIHLLATNLGSTWMIRNETPFKLKRVGIPSPCVVTTVLLHMHPGILMPRAGCACFMTARVPASYSVYSVSAQQTEEVCLMKFAL